MNLNARLPDLGCPIPDSQIADNLIPENLKSDNPASEIRHLTIRNLGYTLIEVLVGLAIIGLLFTIGYAGYRDFAKRQVLNNAYEELKINLNSARQKALSGNKDICAGTFTGIRFAFGGLTDRTSYDFYPKCTSSDGLYTSVSLPAGVTVDTTNAAILFKPVGQGTDLSGDATVTVKSATGERKITITVQGTIK